MSQQEIIEIFIGNGNKWMSVREITSICGRCQSVVSISVVSKMADIMERTPEEFSPSYTPPRYRLRESVLKEIIAARAENAGQS